MLQLQRKIAAKDGRLLQNRRDLGGVIAAARFIGNEENARSGTPQTEGDFAFAEDRHQGTADGADGQRRKGNDDELEGVGQLVRDSFAGSHAQTQQKRRGAFDSLEQLLPRESDVASLTGFDDG